MPMPAPAPIETLYLTQLQALVSYLLRRWPGVPHAVIEDAVQDAFVELVHKPGLLARALAEGGTTRAVGLLRTIAWRNVRATYRRSKAHPTVAADELADLFFRQPPGQEDVIHFHQVWPGAVQRAAEHVSPRHAEALAAALIEKIETGDADTAVSERMGVRREYLCKAKKRLMAELALAS